MNASDPDRKYSPRRLSVPGSGGEYRDISVADPDLPCSSRIGALWRRNWHFVLPARPDRPVELVPFLHPLPGRSMLATMSWTSDVACVVEVSTDAPELHAAGRKTVAVNSRPGAYGGHP